MKNISFKKFNIERLKDPRIAESMLNLAVEEYLEDKDMRYFLRTLKDIIRAQGNLSQIAEKAGLSRQNLYKILNGNQDPRLSTILKLVEILGFTLNFKNTVKSKVKKIAKTAPTGGKRKTS